MADGLGLGAVAEHQRRRRPDHREHRGQPTEQAGAAAAAAGAADAGDVGARDPDVRQLALERLADEQVDGHVRARCRARVISRRRSKRAAVVWACTTSGRVASVSATSSTESPS